MDLRRWMDSMRTRTAMALFLTSLLAGGLLALALAAAADPGAKTISGKGAGGAKAAHAKAGDLEWLEFGTALGEAKAKQKRILVDVYTDWCGWCRRMDRDTYSSPEVRKYLGEAFVSVRLNAESSTRVEYNGNEYTYRELASGFKVSGYPTTLFLEADGKHITTAPGYMKAPDFLAVLRYIGDGHYKKMNFQEYRSELDRPSTSKTAE